MCVCLYKSIKKKRRKKTIKTQKLFQDVLKTHIEKIDFLETPRYLNGRRLGQYDNAVI